MSKEPKFEVMAANFEKRDPRLRMLKKLREAMGISASDLIKLLVDGGLTKLKEVVK